MRWRGGRVSSNVEDIRGRGGMRLGRGTGIGCGGLALLLGIAYLTGTNPLELMQVAEQVQPPAASVEEAAPTGPPQDELGQFAGTVLASTEDVWGKLFAQSGSRYQAPRLVLFTEAVQSACGLSSAATGPFYCPADDRVYLDLSFFAELDRRFGAPGDFAAAYVIAHEVGHHVQNLIGDSDRVRAAQERAGSRQEANEASVALELAADCLAGVWAHHAHRDQNLLEPGDIEEGLAAAAAIGDDRLQRMSTGRVQPESFTHGSSEQRVAALRRGLEAGDASICELGG